MMTDFTFILNGYTPKTVREALCVAETDMRPDKLGRQDRKVIAALIQAIDIIRPLDEDGRHGTGALCTGYCGCDF